ncbi:MAG: UDP-3-O-[3-hydroxymyristoyl] N-acetylglucosamine deacetylase [Rhodobacteraceae bacterium]|nr:UDP-3-O-[3-hydroxymyristoyl] N-acetylglucosamine deacetylase [Paracoccaceae bacterium]
MIPSRQRTLRRAVFFEGKSLHSNRFVRMEVAPARADHGVLFYRKDIGEHATTAHAPAARAATARATAARAPVKGDALVPARWDLAPGAPLCTRLCNAAGVSVGTVEHIMAALAGCGIYNALITLDGPEVPILDGSAKPFVDAIQAGGIRTLDRPQPVLEILSPITMHKGSAWATLSPSAAFHIDFRIDFDDPAIGTQRKICHMANGCFTKELADARTFCLSSDIEAMHRAGRALGGSLENAVVVENGRVKNPEGLRHPDEPVRHKMLDVVGDMALVGMPIRGHYRGVRAGHTLTRDLLHKVLRTAGSCRVVPADAKPQSTRSHRAASPRREPPACVALPSLA